MNTETTTAALPMEDRIKRWRDETSGDETEGVIELLCDAEEELRRRAGEKSGLLAALKSARAIAAEAREHLDADRDMRTLKILMALAGRRGYRADVDAIHDAVEKAEAQS